MTRALLGKYSLSLWAALLVAAIVLVTPRYLDLVTACGHLIPQENMGSDYLKGVLWAIFLGLTILAWPVSRRDKANLLLAWLVKCLLTLFLMLFYESYYGSDANMYFGYACYLPGYIGFNLVGGTIRFMSLVRTHVELLGQSFHAIKVSCSMVGLIGIYLIYRASVIFRGREDRRLFFVLAFFPGILFWSSILGKDPLVFFGIDLYVFGVVGWYCRRSLRYLACIAGGIAVAAVIREWLGPLMLLPLGIFIFHGVRGVLQRVVLISFVAILMLYSGQYMMDRFKISAMQDVVSTMQTASGNMSASKGGSTQQMKLDFSSPGSIVSFLPLTTFSALFRPLPGEVLNPFGLLAGLESLLLLWLLWRALRRTRLRELKDPLVLWGISFVIVWAAVNGVVSSTNFGLTVRYKLQILLVLLGLLLHLGRERRPDEAAPAGAGLLRSEGE